ncbi:MAG: 2-oxoglutarate dehydrogenase E1 component [Rhodospirillales bacterium]|nr:2-oxoglutarate dehydrogenase E1 component [Rhodospirillales bacterium]
MTAPPDSMLTGSNAAYIAELYSRYLENPNSVDPSWVSFFMELDDDGDRGNGARGASWAPPPSEIIGLDDGDAAPGLPPAAAAGLGQRPEAREVRAATLDSIRALMLIRSYRVRGHLVANFDPLGLEGNTHHPELDPKSYGFTEADRDRPIFINNVLGLETATLGEIMGVLKETYCGTIGVEFMHIQEPDEKAWTQRRIESIHNRTQFSLMGKRAIHERLIEAEGFENFLHVKHVGTKRFGLDGGESLIPALEEILKRGSQLGLREVILGMPHRGRLNVLANVMGKPYTAIFSEFQGIPAHPDDVEGSGDVKYHLGTSSDRVFDGNTIHLSLTANPSHLEAVNPVVLGKVRAKQTLIGDDDHSQVMGILLHGDAAFAGQGLVAETLGFSQLRGYQTGGTIHFIVNNQIGFTTSPSYSRSSPYPSDVAKMNQAPIFHVNGDDPEAVVHVARIATEYRQEFKRDVVIDMFCYRRFGHNEGDEPAFTQPIMYRAIAKHPTTLGIYARRLIAEDVVTEAESDAAIAAFRTRLDQDFETAAGYKPNKADWLEGRWKGLIQFSGEEELHEDDTAAPLEALREVGTALSTAPPNFALHPKLTRQLEAKRKMIESGAGIDWATAEALAFGTLLIDGTPVRLSGQDSGRGTFSQRHSVFVDQDNEERYVALNHVRRGQARYEVIDSPLSEFSVLGFEYGYTLSDPNALVLWEGQFGDFANGAQVIIDQFVGSGESKWLRMSGVVMLLPHGFEGQGPEHSSARLERYLQLCAEDNLQVVNMTTPANYFHALRRQVRRNFRKPLVVMAPKSLLRHKKVISKLADLGPDTRFHRVLADAERLVHDKKIRRVVLCSGKVYYDLVDGRRERAIKDVAIVRVEQLYPWPRQGVLRQLARYAGAEVVWCQEDPANMGAWTFVYPRLMNILDELGGKRPVYAGRKASASPATGLLANHQKEQAELVEWALTAKIDDIPQPFRRPKKN